MAAKKKAIKVTEEAARHPVQPLVMDEHGTVRFKINHIAALLLRDGKYDMDRLAMLPFSREDREQFAQLIGYSLGGFSDLSYAGDDTYKRAARQKVHRK